MADPTTWETISAHEGGCGDENGDINIGGDSGDANDDDRMAAAPPPLVRTATTRTTTATLFPATAPPLHAPQRPIADKRRDNPSGGGPGGRTRRFFFFFFFFTAGDHARDGHAPFGKSGKVMAVAGHVILTAVVVVGDDYRGHPDPSRSAAHPAVPLPFVNVTSLHADFNLSLSSATVDAISRGATPPSDAYQWRFAKTSRCQEMLHRFALATLVYTTGGNDSSWITTAGWLKSDGAPVIVARGRVRCQRDRVRAVLVHERLRDSHGLVSSHDLDCHGKRHMTSLLVLALSDNAGSSSIEGDDAAFVKEHFIPTQIGNLVSLTRLELGSNALGGTIPTGLAPGRSRPNWGAFGA
jgi:hypothetical protein